MGSGRELQKRTLLCSAERKLGTPRMAVHPLPTSAAEITGDWLTEVLHGSGALPADGAVAEVQCQALGEGAGMMSDLARLTLTYAGAATGAPPTLVVKLPTKNETNREVAIKYDIYAREVRYYAELDPMCAARTPAIHLSVIDADNHFAIVMQDLSAYRIGNQITGATLEQSEICVDELAKLHGSFWNNIDSFEWLPQVANSQHATNMQVGARAGWDTMLEIFGESVPGSINAVRDPLLNAIDPLQQRLVTPPITLTHGDFRMDNLFFGQTPDHHPLVILDWQGPLRGRSMHDVAHLLCQNTQTEVRRNHERELIERYVDGLAANGVSDYGFDDAWDDYHLAVLYLWAYVVVVSGTLEVGNDRALAWMSKMIERNAAAIEELDCLSLL